MIHRVLIRLDLARRTHLEDVAARHRLSAEDLVQHAAMFTIADLDSGRTTADEVRASAAGFRDGGALLVEFGDFGFERIREAGRLYDLTPEAVLRGAVAHYLAESEAGRVASVPLALDELAEEPSAVAVAEPAAVAAQGAPGPRWRRGSRPIRSRQHIPARRKLVPSLAAVAAAATCAVIILHVPGRDGVPPKRAAPAKPPPHRRPASCFNCRGTGPTVMALGTGLTTQALQAGARAFSAAVSLGTGSSTGIHAATRQLESPSLPSTTVDVTTWSPSAGVRPWSSTPTAPSPADTSSADTENTGTADGSGKQDQGRHRHRARQRSAKASTGGAQLGQRDAGAGDKSADGRHRSGRDSRGGGQQAQSDRQQSDQQQSDHQQTDSNGSGGGHADNADSSPSEDGDGGSGAGHHDQDSGSQHSHNKSSGKGHGGKGH